MRQLGGSFGVALISTFLSRDTSIHRVDVISHLNVNDPTVQNRVAMLAAGMHSHGTDSLTSRNMAYQMMDNSVTMQSTLLSYMDIFMLVGIVFVIFVPFVLLFVKKSKSKVSLADAAH
jgi:MFS transporter, DHA2 family, multidrug resistance protein